MKEKYRDIQRKNSISPFSISPPTEHISYKEHFRTNLVFGLGQFILAITLSLIVYSQTCSNNKIQPMPNCGLVD